MTYDVIVMGAGAAGAATAWFCASRGHRVALVDKAKFPRDKVCTSTINPRSCSYLHEIGVLETLAKEDALTRIRGIQTFSYEGRVFRGFYDPAGPFLNYGHTIPRHRLDKALLDCVQNRRGVDYFEEFEIEDANCGEDQIKVSGRHHGRPCQLRAAVAVDAAGRGSPIARKHGLFTRWDDHRRFALIGQFSGVPISDPMFNVGTNDRIGPGYFCVFPITHDLAIASLMLTERDWTPAKDDPQAALKEFIQSDWILRDWFREAQLASSVAAFGPLAFKSSAVHLDRILMAGDTTGFYDPLTGEGITFAFRSAELAGQAVSCLAAGQSWANVASWYEQSVRGEKEPALQQAIQLQRMLNLREAFNRFVTTLAENPEAANWLACSLGNLLPPERRSIENFKNVLNRSQKRIA